MKHFIIGAISMALVASVALNVVQYRGVLTSPKVVKLEPSDDEKLTSIFEGL